MLSTLLAVVLLPAADVSLPAATQYTLQGTIAPLQEDRSVGNAEKFFDLTLLVAGSEGPGTRLYWYVEENGRGRYSWPDRFGTFTLGANGRPAGTGPALLYDYGDGRSVRPLLPPFLFPPQKAAAGARWEQDGETYVVARGGKLQDRPVWQIEVSNRYGRQRTLWLDQQSPLVVQMKQRVFMGMGREYELHVELVGAKQLEGETLQATLAGYAALIKMRSALNRRERSEDPALTDRQRELLAESLPELQKNVTAGLPLRVLQSARRDLAAQDDRAGSLEQLKQQFEGRPAPQFTAEGLAREKLATADLRGAVTVLHFWEYRDSPLEEPYGQTGYLDFLFQRRKEAGVRVYGVAVDSRLRAEATRGAALRSARKFKSFMNLSYPVLIDDGAVLKQFGDPRRLGAKLPLFVVVGRDGKVLHYHAGYYEVDRNEGLKQLDALVGAALGKE